MKLKNTRRDDPLHAAPGLPRPRRQQDQHGRHDCLAPGRWNTCIFCSLISSFWLGCKKISASSGRFHFVCLILSGFDTCYLHFLGQASAGKLFMRSNETLTFYTFDLGHQRPSQKLPEIDIEARPVQRDILQWIYGWYMTDADADADADAVTPSSNTRASERKCKFSREKKIQMYEFCLPLVSVRWQGRQRDWTEERRDRIIFRFKDFSGLI